MPRADDATADARGWLGRSHPLGDTGLALTRFGLGTAPLGGLLGEVEEREALATIAAAWDAGIRCFDTAPLYGHGTAERRLGRALRDHPREDYVVASKVGRVLQRGAPPDPTQHHEGQPFYRGLPEPDVNPVRDLSAAGVERSLASSLERLGLDRLDVVHVHDPDEHHEQVRDETIPQLCRLRDQGVIGAVGIGSNEVTVPTLLVRETDVDCVLVAGRYTLLDQTALDGLLPAASERGVGIIVGGVYNSGVLADPYRDDATFDYVPASRAVVERARRIDAVCDAHGVELKAAALRFPTGHPAVATVLLGARSVAELEENRRLASAPIPDALWEDLRGAGLLADGVPLPTTGGGP